MSTTTTPTTPTSLLEAVNALLQAIRVSSVMTLLDADLNEDASAAKQAIDKASREVQLEGWYFNTEKDVVLDPEVSGEVYLASNVLKVTSSRAWSGNRLVRRGRRLYDPVKRTYTIGEAVKVNLVVSLVFEDLPEAGRQYITGLAARRFCLPKLPSEATFSYTEEYLARAWAAMENEDAETEDAPLSLTSPHFANFARR